MDLRAVSASIRSEEGAAFIAEAWYWLAQWLSIAPVAPGFPQAIAHIAAELRARSLRSGGAVVELTQQQINDARLAMARFGVANGHYQSNGARRSIYRDP